MFQRIGIDQHTTLARITRRARRNAMHVLAQGKNVCTLQAFIYEHVTEDKVFAVAYEEIKTQTLSLICLREVEVLNFVRRNKKIYEVINGVEVLTGNFDSKVSKFVACNALPDNVVPLEKPNGCEAESRIGSSSCHAQS